MQSYKAYGPMINIRCALHRQSFLNIVHQRSMDIHAQLVLSSYWFTFGPPVQFLRLFRHYVHELNIG